MMRRFIADFEAGSYGEMYAVPVPQGDVDVLPEGSGTAEGIVYRTRKTFGGPVRGAKVCFLQICASCISYIMHIVSQSST
jgi:hypothetical protein